MKPERAKGNRQKVLPLKVNFSAAWEGNFSYSESGSSIFIDGYEYVKNSFYSREEF